MWPVSDHFLATLARNHEQRVKVEFLRDGQVFTSLVNGYMVDPRTEALVSTIGGSVNVSRQTIRRDGTVQILDVSGDMLPTTVWDTFAPYITEMRVWVGVRYWDAPLPTVGWPGFSALTRAEEWEWVPVGTLVLTQVDSAYPVITLQGYDRMWLLGNFTSAYTVDKSTNVRDALVGVLAASVPASRLQVNIPSTNYVTPLLQWDQNTGIADACHELAQVAGWQLYCDPMGTFTATHEPDVADHAVLTYEPGQLSMLFRPTRSVGSGEVYNAVVFTAEGGTTANDETGAGAIRGYAQDDNPESLTYVGHIGVRATFDSSPLVTTKAQCDLAARTTLNRILGVADTIAVPVIPNPAFESGDVIVVSDPDQAIDRLPLIVDDFSVPLRAADGQQELTCRSRVIQ